MTPAVLPTENPTWGFYGETIDLARSVAEMNGAVPAQEYLTAAANARWNQVSQALIELGYAPLIAQRLLDSRWGRHLADHFELVPTDQLRSHMLSHIRGLWGRAGRAFDEALVVARDDEAWG
ncbi:MAG: hypothetical protein ACPGSE_00365 [Synechococcus sp.]